MVYTVEQHLKALSVIIIIVKVVVERERGALEGSVKIRGQEKRSVSRFSEAAAAAD